MDHVEGGLTKPSADTSDILKGVSEIKASLIRLNERSKNVASKENVSEVKTSLTGLDERSKHLATKWDVLAILVLMLGAIAAVAALVRNLSG